ncbi:MAG: aminomethyl-transferring glycine dehydrogenase subunit GcvPA [Syntrophothermus sp.]
MNYIPNTEKDRAEMLKEIGAKDVADLFVDIPEAVRFKGDLKIPGAMSELELAGHMGDLAAKNATTDRYSSFLGAGAYDHFIPAVVGHVLSRSEFYTAYTPYQAEISQGTLQAIYEYQSLICELTGMDVANASMYDGATALAEAALMSVNATGRKEIVVSQAVHPEYREVLKTYVSNLGLTVREVPYKEGVTDLDVLKKTVSGDTACVIIQNPNFFGAVEDGGALGEIAKAVKANYVVCANPISLGLLVPPGEYGADIVVGEGQALGNPISFGGPFLGFLACRETLVRRMPGRIVGATVDRDGLRGFVLTLQTREQHIRREKATSNICSNEALNALAATVYLSMLGKAGIRKVAELNLQKAHYAQKQITALPGFSPGFKAPFFNEFVVETEVDPEELNKRLLDYQIIGGLPLGRFYSERKKSLLFCVTEVRSRQEIDHLVKVLGGLSQ